jgi:hypothetical protein
MDEPRSPDDVPRAMATKLRKKFKPAGPRRAWRVVLPIVVAAGVFAPNWARI